MKNFTKQNFRTNPLWIRLLIMTFMLLAGAGTAWAATPSTLYLIPNAEWKQANARFAAYFFGNGEQWSDVKDSDGDGIYEVSVPSGYSKVIFCRMNPSAAANNWNNKWNQTGDLTIPTDGKNQFKLSSGVCCHCCLLAKLCLMFLQPHGL